MSTSKKLQGDNSPGDDDSKSLPLADSPWLDTEQAGEYLGGYSAWSIRSFVKQKLITYTRAPGRNTGFRFRREWLDGFLESRAIPAKVGPKRLTAEWVKASRNAAKQSAANAPQPRETIPMDPALAAAVERAKARLNKRGGETA